MIPPTPTFIPDATSTGPLIEFPSVWTMAPDAIQAWHKFSGWTSAIQILLVLLLVGLALYMIYRFVRRLNGDQVNAQ